MRFKAKSEASFKSPTSFRRVSFVLALTVASAALLVLPGFKDVWQHSASAQASESSSAVAPSNGDANGMSAATAQDAPVRRTDEELKRFDGLAMKAAERGSVRVIVGLNASFTPEGYLDGAKRAKQRAQIKLKQDSLLKQLEAHKASSVVQFKSIRYLGITADAETIEFLKSSPDVRSIREDELRNFSLVQSTDMIGAPIAWRAGLTGLGQVIAILDTGVDKNHPFLAGKVIAEACFSTTDTGKRSKGICPTGESESFAPGSALPCQFDAEGCRHGTEVAGIAAGRSLTNMQGVAPDASIVAIQVSVEVDDPGVCAGEPRCVKPSDLDYMKALDYLLTLKYDNVNIVAANLSLGGQLFPSNCDSFFPDLAELIGNLRAADIATVVAAGNGGETQKLEAPACISSAISVGSVGDGSFGGPMNTFAPRDVVASDSNNAPFLSLLAPGEWINTSSPGVGFVSDRGTSLAAPHVAGAWALLRQQAPNVRVQHILDVLKSTGVPVTDTRKGADNTKPRIQINQALLALQLCTFSLSATSGLATSAASSGAFNVFTPAGCAWTAVSNDPWITTSSGGNGSGVFGLSVTANSGAARVGTISIGTATFTVFQAPAGATLPGTFKMPGAGVTPSAFIGNSVAISGDTAIAGAPGDDIGLNLDQGSAYVFVRSGAMWALQQKLTVPDGAAGDQFGWSVSVSGNTIVVGAPGDDINANADQGSAYVFVRSGTTWALQQKLVQADGAAADNFGLSVALDLNTAVVGAFRDDDGLQQDNGSAYVFTRSGTAWTPQAKLLAADRASSSQFGFSVGVSGDTAIVGARFEGFGPTTPDRGAAYIFARSGTTWAQQDKLVAHDRGAGDHFGFSVAINGATAVVGSRFDDVGLNVDQGSAYVFRRSGKIWLQRAKLTASDGAANDQFGISVALSDNIVIVGASQTASRNGKAYFFGRNGSRWVQQPTLFAPDGLPGDFFGSSVAVSSDTAVVGAVLDDALRGSAYIFSPLTLTGVSTVQFASATQSVAEGTWKIQTTVTRTGSDLASPASVDFATADGSAVHSRDYIQTLGTLHFAPGETSKTITVFITDDVVPESPETFSIVLSEPVGTALGPTPKTTVTINSNDSVLGGNPVDAASFSPDFFVRQHYVDFLNREADASGLAFWVGNFNECGSNQQCREVKRVNISAAFFLSIEFQETGYFVYRIYKTAFGDAASANVAGTVPVVRLEDFLPDTQEVGAGVQVNVGNWQQQLEINKAAYVLNFVQRQRFLAAFPMTLTPAQFVDQLNQNAGGVLSPFDRIQLITALTLNNNVLGRAGVLRQIAEHPLLRVGELRRAFVLMQYFGYLRRNPDDSPEATLNYAGWKFWLDKLNQNNGDPVRAEMVKAFITSTEYKNRFVR